MPKRFHYIALPHVPVSSKYPACAFTNKVHKLCKMLMAKGHEVYLYGVGYTDAECTEFIQCQSLENLKKAYGDPDSEHELGYDITGGFRHDINQERKPYTKAFDLNAMNEINLRKKDDDFLLLSQGVYQKPIADAVNLYLTCEPGVGYRGSYAPFRAYESSFIQNFTYGSENPRGDINGKHYDRVIPNYFEPSEFTFNADPQDYVMFIGRLIERKGLEIAFRVAKELDKKLVVAGQGDWDTICKYDNENVEYLGVLDQKQRDYWVGNAKAVLVPTLYLEPFGGVAVEAMLTGTPVITTNFGAFTDTVVDGVSGYRCDTLKDFIENTRKAFLLDRQKVWEYAKRYTTDSVNELFEKWWNDLYQVYLSTKGESRGWYEN